MTGRELKDGPATNGPGPQWRYRSMSLQSESGCQGGLAVSPDRKVPGEWSAAHGTSGVKSNVTSRNAQLKSFPALDVPAPDCAPDCAPECAPIR
jgi:hypothetical protein